MVTRGTSIRDQLRVNQRQREANVTYGGGSSPTEANSPTREWEENIGSRRDRAYLGPGVHFIRMSSAPAFCPERPSVLPLEEARSTSFITLF
jgi:hypothetical protein